MKFHLSWGRAGWSLCFVALAALPFAAAQRRLNEEARRNAERAEAMQRDANRPNERGTSAADALGRTYADQWKNQAEREKARKAAQDAAVAQSRADELARRERLSAEQAARQAKFTQRTQERLHRGLAATLTAVRQGDRGAEALIPLLYFNQWFPALAEATGSWAAIDQLAPGNRTAAISAALEKAFAAGVASAPWHAALLEAERAWSDDGQFGLAWINAIDAGQKFSEPPDTLAYEARRARKEPFDWADMGIQRDLLAWEGDLDQPLHWRDLGRHRHAVGFVTPRPARAPQFNSGNIAALEQAALRGDAALLVLAAGLSSGQLGLPAGDPSRTGPLLARLREVLPGYGQLLTGLWQRTHTGSTAPEAVETALRAAIAAGGLPARLATLALKPLEAAERNYASLVKLWRENPEALRARGDAAHSLAWRYLSGEALDRIDPALANLTQPERNRAALACAAELSRLEVERIEYDSHFHRAHLFLCLHLLEQHAPTRLDLTPVALSRRPGQKVPEPEIRAALPPEIATLYLELLEFPGLGLSPLRMQDPGWPAAVKVARERLVPRFATHPGLMLLAPELAAPGAPNDDERHRRTAIALSTAGLPVPDTWAAKVNLSAYAHVTQFDALARLRPTHGVSKGMRLLREWLRRNPGDDTAPDRDSFQRALRAASLSGALESEMTGLVADYSGIFGAAPARPPVARTVDRGTSPEVARAAHFVNATLGSPSGPVQPLPDDHPSVAWVRAAAERGDRAAVFVLGKRLQAHDPARAWRYWFETARRGHPLALRQLLSIDNPLLSEPAGLALLWDLHREGLNAATAWLGQATELLAARHLPGPRDSTAPTNTPAPAGNVDAVLDAVTQLTAAQIPTPAVIEKLLQPMAWVTPQSLSGLDESGYVWIADRPTRLRVLQAARDHVRQAILRPGHPNVTTLKPAIAFLGILAGAEGVSPALDDVEAALETAHQGVTGSRDAAWSLEAAGQWMELGLVLRRVAQPARALEAFRRSAALHPAGTALLDWWLEAAFAAPAKAEIAQVAGRALAFPDAELKGESLALLTRVGLALAGPYGLPRDEARLRAITALLAQAAGFVPTELAPFAAPVSAPPGSEEWTRRLDLLRRFIQEENCPPPMVARAWTLASPGLNQPPTAPVRTLLVPYEVIVRLESTHRHPEATRLIATIQKNGSPEQRARLLCGEWQAVEPFEAADRLVERIKAGDLPAQRALELWILDDRLPLDAVVGTYLREAPALRTPAVGAWLKRQPAK